MKTADLHKAVNYCSESGVFTRLVSAGNAKAGTQIGSFDKKGYLKAMLFGEYVKLHRLAWFYVYGDWPNGQLDHINGCKTDNRINNLRVCSTSENCLNQHGPRANNESGLQGVHKIEKTGRYRAKCSINGINHHLGVFATSTEAHKAYTSFKAPYIPERIA